MWLTCWWFHKKLPFQHMPSLFTDILNAMYRCSLSVLLKMFRYPCSSGIFAPDLFRLKFIVNLYFDWTHFEIVCTKFMQLNNLTITDIVTLLYNTFFLNNNVRTFHWRKRWYRINVRNKNNRAKTNILIIKTC